MRLYHERQNVLAKELDKLERQLKRNIFKAYGIADATQDYELLNQAIMAYKDKASEHGYDFIIARRLNDCRVKRIQLLKKRLSSIVKSGKAIFLTLTFTDGVLNATSVKTRRRYVARYLKAAAPVYVANIDFGAKRGREHYHAVVSGDQVDLLPWRNYGAINAKKIRNQDLDLTRTSKYVAKLSSHAVKKTAAMPRLIYSR